MLAGAVKVSQLNLVDLAGSERVGHTAAQGIRLKEGGHINKSLLALGTVIAKLSEGDNAHIPYRDSKLTRILQPSLGGNARTGIICTITPAQLHVEESISTLRFAQRAKSITNKPQINEKVSDGTLLKRYKEEINQLRQQLNTRNEELGQSRQEAQTIQDSEANSNSDLLKKLQAMRLLVLDSKKLQKKAGTAKLARRKTWFPGVVAYSNEDSSEQDEPDVQELPKRQSMVPFTHPTPAISLDTWTDISTRLVNNQYVDFISLPPAAKTLVETFQSLRTQLQLAHHTTHVAESSLINANRTFQEINEFVQLENELVSAAAKHQRPSSPEGSESRGSTRTQKRQKTGYISSEIESVAYSLSVNALVAATTDMSATNIQLESTLVKQKTADLERRLSLSSAQIENLLDVQRQFETLLVANTERDLHIESVNLELQNATLQCKQYESLVEDHSARIKELTDKNAEIEDVIVQLAAENTQLVEQVESHAESEVKCARLQARIEQLDAVQGEYELANNEHSKLIIVKQNEADQKVRDLDCQLQQQILKAQNLRADCESMMFERQKVDVLYTETCRLVSESDARADALQVELNAANEKLLAAGDSAGQIEHLQEIIKSSEERLAPEAALQLQTSNAKAVALQVDLDTANEKLKVAGESAVVIEHLKETIISLEQQLAQQVELNLQKVQLEDLQTQTDADQDKERLLAQLVELKSQMEEKALEISNLKDEILVLNNKPEEEQNMSSALQNESKLAHQRDSTLTNNKSELVADLTAKLEKEEAFSKSLQGELFRAGQKHSCAVEMLSAKQSQLDEQAASIGQLQIKLDDAEAKDCESTCEIRKLEENLSETIKERDNWSDQINEMTNGNYDKCLEFEEKLANAIKERDNWLEQVHEMTDANIEMCEGHTHELQKLRKAINELQFGKQALESSVKKAADELAIARTAYSNLEEDSKTRVIELTNLLDTTNKALKDLQSEISTERSEANTRTGESQKIIQDQLVAVKAQAQQYKSSTLT